MSAETEKKKVAEEIWLRYFNERLFEQGIIDGKTRNKIALKLNENKRTDNSGGAVFEADLPIVERQREQISDKYLYITL